MKKIIKYYSNLNLQNKLRFSYILLILIPVTLLCIIYYSVASDSILDIAKKNILDVTVKNLQIIDRQLESIQTGAANINVDADVFGILQRIESAPQSELLRDDKKMNAILHKYFPSDYILSATIMTPRYVFGDNSQLIIPNEHFFDSDIYKRIKGKKGEAQWIPTFQTKKEFELDYEVDHSTTFSLAQELNPIWIDPENPNDIKNLSPGNQAILILYFKEELIRDMFEGSSSVENAFYCISSPEGVVVAHSDSKKNGTTEALPWLEETNGRDQGSILLTYEGEKAVVCFAVSEVTGWIAATVTPVQSLLNNVSKIQLLTILVWTLLFTLAMVLAAVFSKRITKPVEQLVYAMKHVGEGDFGLRLPTNGTDEMQYLTEKYNEMGEKIEVLIEENYKSEIRKKETEIMALNLQMNPHFLYNTLNIINMMALEEGNAEVSKMLISLSDMLQYTFRNQQEMVSFEEEYLWLQNYLHIMQIRFEGKFQVNYEVDKAAFSTQIPKLLLQPLMENAIVHGFRGMAKGGVLTLAAEIREENVCIEIRDNGKGMKEEELQKAMNGDYNRIGLSNAIKRLWLIYGTQGKMEVDTKPEKGTIIRVSYPVRKKK